MGSKAIVRSHPERIDGVSRTWFEWVDEGADLVKVLVAEVDFDTDPNSTEFQQSVIDAIKDTAHGVPRDETTMIVSHFELSSGRGSRTPSWAQGATVTGRVNRLALPRPRPSQEGHPAGATIQQGGCLVGSSHCVQLRPAALNVPPQRGSGTQQLPGGNLTHRRAPGPAGDSVQPERSYNEAGAVGFPWSAHGHLRSREGARSGHEHGPAWLRVDQIQRSRRSLSIIPCNICISPAFKSVLRSS
jgi:hypothetical protein